MLRLARPQLGGLLGAGLLAAGTELAALALLATATWLLVTAAGRPPLDALTVAIVAVRALAISRGVLRYAERLAGHDATLRVVTEVRARIFAALAARPGSAPRTGDALSRLVSDTEAVQDLLLRVLVPGVAAAGVGLLAVGGAAVLSPAAAAALATGLLLAGGLLPAVAVVTTRRAAQRLAPLRGALAVDAVDLTHGAADLAAFGATETALRRTRQRAAELARLERRLATVGWAVDGTGVLLAGATSATVVLVGLATGVYGASLAVLAVGALVAVESALALVGAARQWTQLRAGLRRVAALLADSEPTVGGAAKPAGNNAEAGSEAPSIPPPAGQPDPARRPGDALAPPTPSGGRHFRLVEVEVNYRSTATPALHRLTLDLPPGRRIAVVGPSGAGKSTLLAVLAGMVAPEHGQATVDGVAVASLPPQVRCRLVGGLLADAHVFHASVRENLLLARPDATEEELAAAVTTAGLADWLHDQPDGWNTLVGEDGGQLSGGQRQRLVLARALLAAPRLLLLDEPTEGLDPVAADRVLASVLGSLPADRSMVLVTHRLAGLDDLDEVLVLDAGRVIQRGRHAELAVRPGWYRDQWLAQQAAERGYAALATTAPTAAPKPATLTGDRGRKPGNARTPVPPSA